MSTDLNTEDRSFLHVATIASVTCIGISGAYQLFTQPNTDTSASVRFIGTTDEALARTLNAAQRDVRFSIQQNALSVLVVEHPSINPQTKLSITPLKEGDGVTVRAFQDHNGDNVPNGLERMARPIAILPGDFAKPLAQEILKGVWSIQQTD